MSTSPPNGWAKPNPTGWGVISISVNEKNIPAAVPTARKIEQVANLSDLIGRSKGLYITDYRGFTVAEKADLTRRLRAADAEFHVVKNTLFKLAYADSGEDPAALLEGPSAVAFALGDPVAPAKIVLDFIKEKKKGTVKGAVVEGRVYDIDSVTKLSELPSRDQLIAQVVGAVQGPLYGLVFSLQGVLGNFVRTVQAIHDQKAEAGA